MIQPKFEFNNSWEDFEKLYQKLQKIYTAKKNYDELLSFDRDAVMETLLTDYSTVASDDRAIYRMLAKAANDIIVDYVVGSKEEES